MQGDVKVWYTMAYNNFARFSFESMHEYESINSIEVLCNKKYTIIKGNLDLNLTQQEDISKFYPCILLVLDIHEVNYSRFCPPPIYAFLSQ